MYRVSLFLLAALAACSAGAPAGCDSCGIVLDTVVTLGSDGGPGAMTRRPNVSRDSRGRYYVAMPDWPEEPLVYDADGTFRQAIGARGDGPGEYRSPRFVLVGAGDTLVVIDGTGGLTVLSPDYEVVHTGRVRPGAFDAALREDGHLLIDIRVGGDSAVHQYDPSGGLVRSFGNGRGLCPACPSPVFSLAPAAGNMVWGVHRIWSYLLTRWDSAGREMESWVVDADWHPTVDSLPMPSATTPGFAQVMGAWIGREGRLWVVGSAAALDWRAGLGPPQPGPRGTVRYPIESYTATYDAVVDVIDLDTQRRMAHLRMPEYAIVVEVAPDLIAALRESETGWWFADIYRVRLVSDS